MDDVVSMKDVVSMDDAVSIGDLLQTLIVFTIYSFSRHSHKPFNMIFVNSPIST